MGFIRKAPGGTFRACWRDPAGKQLSKSFPTKREASVFLADIATTMNRGTYVAPSAGKLRFRVYAERWAANRNLSVITNERTTSTLRNHILPKWADWPIGRIDHGAVQEWVTELGKTTMAPATVAKCYGMLRSILRSAIRAKLIATDPTEGVTAPSTYQPRPLTATISREVLCRALLPAVPLDHRALVAVAAGAGLRWGEAAGLAWGAIDLENQLLRVGQVVVETATETTIRAYPKSRAGVRVVPLPDFLLTELAEHRDLTVAGAPDARALVFATRNGTPLRRSNFRRQVWRPALVRAGLLGEVVERGQDRWRASWTDTTGMPWAKEFPTEREAVAHVVQHAVGGLRFHDLRHSYATWLISDGVPVNVVQRVMGHEQASTTLNRYTHTPDDYRRRVLDAFSGSAASSLPRDRQPAYDDDE